MAYITLSIMGNPVLNPVPWPRRYVNEKKPPTREMIITITHTAIITNLLFKDYSTYLNGSDAFIHSF